MDDFVAYMKPVLMTLHVIMTKIMKVKHTEDITNYTVSSPLHCSHLAAAEQRLVWYPINRQRRCRSQFSQNMQRRRQQN
jgi:hypothetical protein